MTNKHIKTEIEQRVLTIMLNRPDKLNAWTEIMEREVEAAIRHAAVDDRVRAIVITGSGRGFCAGADMAMLETVTSNNGGSFAPEMEVAVESHPATTDFGANYQHKFSYMLDIPKPIFAAINGSIAGIGLCLALYCDFRYMASNNKLTTAFAARGLVAEHGISWMLPRLVGITNALDLLYTSRVVLTQEAATMGLVKELPQENFLSEVKKLAYTMVHISSPRSIGVMKRQVFDAMMQDIHQAWKRADAEMLASFESEDFQEGVAHWLEKREPQFTGR